MMRKTWLAIEKDGTEICSNNKPEWDEEEQCWWCAEEMCDGNYWPSYTTLPKGSIEKLLGYKLTFENSPIIL